MHSVPPFSCNVAVVIALAQGNNEGNSTLVYCLEVLGENEEKTRVTSVVGQPFRLSNDAGFYIWKNEQLREKGFTKGTLIYFQKSRSYIYCGNVGTMLDMNIVHSQLQFGNQGYNAVAYRGIEEAFPNAEIAERGIYINMVQQNGECGPDPTCALICVKSAKIVDGRVYLTTRLDEECDLKNNCRNNKHSTIEEVSLPIQVPLSETDVGSVMLISFGSKPTAYQRYQAVCESILISSANLSVPDGIVDETPVRPPGLHEYEVRNNPQGLCFILNNSVFENEALNRRGAEYDEAKLKALFQLELLFDVHVKNNLTGNQMREVAIEVAHRDHSAFDSLVFIVMSHGSDRDRISGVDGRHVGIEELMSEFTATKCPTLQNKPKIFILQACRGSLTESMVPANRHADSVPRLSADSTLVRGACPSEADFLLAFAAAPGYPAYRDEESGSLFIEVLVNVLRTHHRDNHLSELLQEVTRQVADSGTEEAVQVSAHSNTLRAKLYL